MRPTVEEQLLGTCRVLETVVAPCVADPYAQTMLSGLIANLRMLTAALPAIPRFLDNDNKAMAALLGQFRAAVAPHLATQITHALARPEPEAVDAVALEHRNGELRELFSQALCGTGLTPAMRTAALEHMTARAARAPMRYVSTASTPAKAA